MHCSRPQEVHSKEFVPAWRLRFDGVDSCTETGAMGAAEPRALLARHGDLYLGQCFLLGLQESVQDAHIVQVPHLPRDIEVSMRMV